jgi:uncharacterized protein (DUF1501 family)
MERCLYACGTDAHVSRRGFLGALSGVGALGLAGFAGMTQVRGAEQLTSQQKHVVVFCLHGGVSQLETWDPKPGTPTGGPFRAISTSVPGVEICELLPHTAKQMHHLALVRGVNTAEDDHGKGMYIMETGRRQQPGFEYPYLGSAFSSLLSPADNPLPGYMVIGGGANPTESAFLGPRHAPVAVNGTNPPANITLPGSVPPEADIRRRALRAKLGQRFSQGRRGAETEAYNASFDQAASLMGRKEVFDFSKIPEADVAKYGPGDFAKHCLLARRLIESGVTFVSVRHTNYDTHSENFNFHLEQLGEFDLPFATFVSDLAERGMLQHTLIIVMSEFGRTPNINHLIGRDHWSKAWSVALGGCGIKGGAVVGKTNENGTEVIDRQVNGGHLFHTYYRAVGLDSTKSFYDADRPVPKADPATDAITEILA